MAIDPHASRDPLANKRYAYAKALQDEGDHAGAVDLFEQALELDPTWPAGWYALGLARLEAGAPVAAAEDAFRQALALDPADTYGAGLRLARLTGEAPEAPPESYVRTLFDQYAERFDDVLVDRLGYRAPALLSAALERAAPGRRFERVLDWGCGTGLMAQALVGRYGHIDGSDLSPGMVEAAAGKGLYATLSVGNVLDAPAPEAIGAYDLIIAADVLCYLGELSPVFAGARARLADEGLFAFSVEALDPLLEDAADAAGVDAPAEGLDFALLPSLRYAHGFEGLVERAAAAGFQLIETTADILRHDRGRPVLGYVLVFGL